MFINSGIGNSGVGNIPHKRHCNPDVELLCLSLRLFFLLREFGNIVMHLCPQVETQEELRPKWRTVYIDSCNIPDAPMLILRDFDHSKLEMSWV